MKADGKDYNSRKPVGTKSVATTDKPRTLKEWLGENKESFLQALPQNTINVDRFISAAAMEIMGNRNLMICDKPSIAQSLLMAARYGMEVGPLLGQAWLIPYNETRFVGKEKKKVMTCHFQLGYKGLIVLARRSNTIKTISCEVVYENDFFDVEMGIGRKITHKPNFREERGEPIAYYCLVELENGGFQFGVMSKKDVEKHRNTFSKGYDATDSGNIWVKNFDAMALKTVAIKTLKLCPISVEALEAVSREERLEAGLRDVSPEFGAVSEDSYVSDVSPEDDIPGEYSKEPEQGEVSSSTSQITKTEEKKVIAKEPTDAELAKELAEMNGEAEFPEPPDPNDDLSLF